MVGSGINGNNLETMMESLSILNMAGFQIRSVVSFCTVKPCYIDVLIVARGILTLRSSFDEQDLIPLVAFLGAEWSSSAQPLFIFITL